MTKAGSAKKTRIKAAFKRELHKRLTEQREEIVDIYEHDLAVGQASSEERSEDLVDRANDAYNREFMFSLSTTERELLTQIDEALDRIEANQFGWCLNCGDPISEQRLQAVPWARYCIDCQELVEQGLLQEP